MQRTLLLSLIAVSYILFAGGPRWTLLPLAIMTAAVVVAAPRRTFAFPREARALDASLIAIMAAMVMQIVPLPRAVVAALSPHAADVSGVLRFQPIAAPAWTTLSLDPDQTTDALIIFVIAVVSFWAARGVFSFGASTRRFCRTLALIGGAGAVSAVIFRAATPGLVNGMLRPEARSAYPFGAFVNRNHFAGWLLLVSGPVCGYLIAHLRIHPAYRQRFRLGLKQFLASGAVLTAMAATTIVGVLLLTLSRSAVAGLGSASMFGWRVGRRRLRIERTNLPFVLAVVGVGLLAAAVFVDIGGWATRLEETVTISGDRTRLAIWRESLPILRDFWLTGTGAGTFGDAMVKYQETRVWVGSVSRWAHFNNAHSHYLQAAAEGGVLLLVPIGCALVSGVALGRRAVREDRGEMQWARIGAAGSLIGIAVQSIWEISLTMPANAILCGIIAGLMLYQRQPVTGHAERSAAADVRGAAR